MELEGVKQVPLDILPLDLQEKFLRNRPNAKRLLLRIESEPAGVRVPVSEWHSKGEIIHVSVVDNQVWFQRGSVWARVIAIL